MITILDDLPPNVIGLEAKGKLTEDDYVKTIVPQIEQKQRDFDKVRMLFVLGRDFDGLTVGALWEDSKLTFKRPGSWEKIAVVSDSDLLKTAMTLFSWMVPGEMKIFPTAKTAEATTWVSAA
jgi:hypothetical protein